MTVIAGLDEAGYGPTLGPLVVAAATFRLADGVKEAALHRLIGLSEAAGGLAIGDSKQLYRGRDRFARLETSVLGHVALGRGVLPLRVRTLLAGAVDFDPHEAEELPWYAGRLLGTVLPRRADAADILARSARQAELLAERGMEFLDVHVAPVCEPRFNRLTMARDTKAWPLFMANGRLIDTLMARHPLDELVILADRHGGRVHYHEMLAEFFPLAPISTLTERNGESSYRMDFPNRPPVRLSFQVRADGRRAPVALASLVAKTVRELFMESLNAWFAERVPGVRPTAGYPEDAQRFLRDVAPTLDVSAPRHQLIRVR